MKHQQIKVTTKTRRKQNKMNNKAHNIGIMFRCYNEPEALIPFVQEADALGYDEIWLVEDCFYAGGIASTAVTLANTKQARIGLGIMPAVVRNPAFAAMELSALARLYPNRIMGGIGHGVGAWMKQIGAFPPSQLNALEEVTHTVRALLRGEDVDFHGRYVSLDHVQLNFPPEIVPPVYLGVRGSKSLRVSGRVADGTILAEHTSPAYVRWAKERITQGQRDTGRIEDSHRITVYAWCILADDTQSAIAQMRPHLATGIVSGTIAPSLEAMGITEEAEHMAQQGESHLAKHMPDELVQQMSIVGTTDDAVNAIHEYYKAGADSVVLVPMSDDYANMQRFAQEILPRLRDASARIA
jgi:5,10-methylenetetrahydromethanopterin reductase